MREHEEAIGDAGGRVAAIGTGDLAYAQDFREQFSLTFPVLVDPDMTTYKVVGTKKGRLRDGMKPSVVAAGARATARGRRQGRTGPQPMALGATHLVLPDGNIPYAWVNEDFADNAPIAEVVALLDGGVQ